MSERDSILGDTQARKLSRDQQLQNINRAGHEYYYSPYQEFDDKNKIMVIREVAPYVKEGNALELGYTNSIWTDALLSNGATSVTVIEAADNHIERAKKDFDGDPRVNVIQTLFEEFEPRETFSTVLMSGVIKHVPDDLDLMKRSVNWLVENGVVIATTPNSRSMHRRLGALMGLEAAPDQHNQRDREVFNVRLYDRYSWRALFIAAGYDVLMTRGVFLKPFSTEQMMCLAEKYDIDQIMEGLRHLGEELQDYAWYLYLIAQRRP